MKGRGRQSERDERKRWLKLKKKRNKEVGGGGVIEISQGRGRKWGGKLNEEKQEE